MFVASTVHSSLIDESLRSAIKLLTTGLAICFDVAGGCGVGTLAFTPRLLATGRVRGENLVTRWGSWSVVSMDGIVELDNRSL